jgi:hypothetical protein
MSSWRCSPLRRIHDVHVGIVTGGNAEFGQHGGISAEGPRWQDCQEVDQLARCCPIVASALRDPRLGPEGRDNEH